MSGMSPMFDPTVATGGISAVLVVTAIGALGVILGVIWILRMTRNPDDEPKSWRYHDHD